MDRVAPDLSTKPRSRDVDSSQSPQGGRTEVAYGKQCRPGKSFQHTIAKLIIPSFIGEDAAISVIGLSKRSSTILLASRATCKTNKLLAAIRDLDCKFHKEGIQSLGLPMTPPVGSASRCIVPVFCEPEREIAGHLSDGQQKRTLAHVKRKVATMKVKPV